MDQDRARGVLNQLFYPIDSAPDLSEATAARLVDNLIDGRLFSAPVTDFAEAIDQTLEAGALHPQTVESSLRYAEPELLAFLRLVARQLTERRPWPPPKFTKLALTEWATFAAATPIARIERPRNQIDGAVGARFDETPGGAVLILRLRTGETVALLGSTDPRPASFVLLQRDPGDPAVTIGHFLDLTGFRPSDVTGP